MVKVDNLENTKKAKMETKIPETETQQREEPKRKKLPPAPPPPRISSNIADQIQVSESQSTVANSNVTPNHSANESKACTKQIECSSPPCSSEVKSSSPPILTPHPTFDQKSSSPYSPLERVGDSQKPSPDAGRSEEVVESVSILLKSREDSIAKYKKEINELTKSYEKTKNALIIKDEQVNDLQKKVEELSHDKVVMVHAFDKERQRLQGQVNSLQMEMTKIKDENEASEKRASDLSSTLNYTKAALSAQKLLFDMQARKLAQYERENAEIKQKATSGESDIHLKERIVELENAIKEDVADKNVVVEAFNLYIAKVQKRVFDVFEEKPRNSFSDCRRDEGYDSSSLIPFESIKRQAPSEADSSDTVHIPRPNNDNDSNKSNTSTGPENQNTFHQVKAEKMSPCESEKKEVCSREVNLKRKVFADNDNDSNSDSVVLISSNSENNENESNCKKKTKLV